MAHVINLKKPVEEPAVPPVQPVISHPVVQEQHIITDSGENVPFRTLRWQAPAAYRRDGTIAPYIFAALVLVGAMLTAVLSHDAITTIFFALIGIMVIVHARRSVPLVDIEINPLGITVGGKTYRYETVTSFWVDYEPEFDIREISLHLKRWSSPLVKIQLGAQDPVQAHLLLIEFIPETRHESTFAHTLVRWLGI